MLNLLRKRLNVVGFEKRLIYTPGSRNSQNSLIASNKFFPLDRVNVTMLNSNSPLGEATALTLKQNPLVRDLVIHCKSGTIGIYKDLRLVPTSTTVQAFVGAGQLKHALSKADIVLINGKFEPDEVTSSKEMFKKNLEYTKFMAEAMVQFCPNAIVIIDIYPINITFPYFAEILSENGVFCANRLLGSVSLHTLRAQSILGQVLGIRPNKVNVDLIGGGTPETLIPVISSCYPGGPAINCVADKIRDKIIKMNSEVFAVSKSVAVLSHAYSLAAFIGKVAEGLTGRENVRANAFIRTTALMGIEFFTMPVGLGIAGIEMNYGIPKLSDKELRLMDQIFPILQSEIEYGINHARPPPPLVEGPEASRAPTCQPIPCEF